jgi:acetylornithine/N-succinyldiaminopimelate aminotransferase
MFGWQHAGVRPDIMTLGKGIGGGVPLSALLASDTAMAFEHGDQGGTYCGNPLMAAVGLAVVDAVANPSFLATVRARGEELQQGLAALIARHRLPGQRGRGLLQALDLGKPLANAVVDRARALAPDGLLLNAPRPNLLRFMPALNLATGSLQTMLQMLDHVLTQATEEVA